MLKTILTVKYASKINYTILRSNVIMASAEKKPKTVYKATLNYRNIPGHKFVSGPGPMNRVFSKWHENNDDINDYNKMLIHCNDGSHINLSEELFNIKTNARTRIFHLESGLERVNNNKLVH